MVYDVELEKYHVLFVKRNGKVTLSGNCRCTLNNIPKGFKWNPETQMFDLPDEKQKMIRKPIRIKIGEKESFV